VKHPGRGLPAGFDPSRFLPGGTADPAMRHRYAFIPFGGGRRACIGAAFAELETTLVLATITRRFRLELITKGMPAPVARVTLRPGQHLPMRLRHRRWPAATTARARGGHAGYGTPDVPGLSAGPAGPCRHPWPRPWPSCQPSRSHRQQACWLLRRIACSMH
jgi:hypothetical protein